MVVWASWRWCISMNALTHKYWISHRRREETRDKRQETMNRMALTKACCYNDKRNFLITFRLWYFPLAAFRSVGVLWTLSSISTFAPDNHTQFRSKSCFLNEFHPNFTNTQNRRFVEVWRLQIDGLLFLAIFHICCATKLHETRQQ